jgi:hypothetical protein
MPSQNYTARTSKRSIAVAFVLSFITMFPITAPAQILVTESVPMRDGVSLATDVYLTLLGTQRPAILLRTPYGRRESSTAGVAYLFLLAGYVVAIQDMRGTGDSAGVNDAFVGEMQDGYDTVEWVASQPWCNGEVGMFGVSALGIGAYLAAAARPPSLKTAVVGFATGDLYRALYPGGELRAEILDGWIAPQSPAYVNVVLANPVYTPFWHEGSAERVAPMITIPIYHVGGWYDPFQQRTLDMYFALQYFGGLGARGNQKLLMGPWTHVNLFAEEQGELVYSGAIYDNAFDEILMWFNYWLHDEPNGIRTPTVRYYLMGDTSHATAPGNIWVDADRWPPAAQSRRLYLGRPNHLSAQPPHGDAARPGVYIYHPLNPVPTRGGANLSIAAGPYDQQSIESRGDVLVYTSDPLTQPLTVAGRVLAELFTSSTAVDTDWTAKLIDVYPDGRAMLVCDGILRARYRFGVAAPFLLTPGRRYSFLIDLWSTALVFDAGHRIRVEISSSNSPRFEPNLDNGLTPRAGGSAVITANTIFYGSETPSSLILPVISPAAHPIFQGQETEARRWPLYR